MNGRNVVAVLVVSVLVILSAGVYVSGITGPVSNQGSSTNNNIPTSTTVATRVLEIQIPLHSSVPPPGFNVSNLLTGAFHYRFNFTVVIGVNNTVVWKNEDVVDHTVDSFLVPDGAKEFNSGLIQPNGTYSTTLVVPGVYKYTCIWHPFLAGEIRVKAAT